MKKEHRPYIGSREKLLEKMPASKWILPFFISMLFNAGALELGTRALKKDSIVRIDGASLDKNDFLKKIENGNLSFEEFTWAQESFNLQERTGESIALEKRKEVQKKVELAKETFEKIIYQAQLLEQTGAPKQKVIDYIMSFFGDHPHTQNLEGYSTVVELLTEGIGNCEARAKYGKMALERLYGEDVKSEILVTNRVHVDKKTGEATLVPHVYTSVQVGDDLYSMDGRKLQPLNEEVYNQTPKVDSKTIQTNFLQKENGTSPDATTQKNEIIERNKLKNTLDTIEKSNEVSVNSLSTPPTHSGLLFTTSGHVDVVKGPYNPGNPNMSARNAITSLHDLPSVDEIKSKEHRVTIEINNQPTEKEILIGDIKSIIHLKDAKQAKKLVEMKRELNSNISTVAAKYKIDPKSVGLHLKFKNLQSISPEALRELGKYRDLGVEFPSSKLFDTKEHADVFNSSPRFSFAGVFSIKQKQSQDHSQLQNVFDNLHRLQMKNLAILIPEGFDETTFEKILQNRTDTNILITTHKTPSNTPDSYKNFHGHLRVSHVPSFSSRTENTQFNQFVLDLISKAHSDSHVTVDFNTQYTKDLNLLWVTSLPHIIDKPSTAKHVTFKDPHPDTKYNSTFDTLEVRLSGQLNSFTSLEYENKLKAIQQAVSADAKVLKLDIGMTNLSIELVSLIAKTKAKKLILTYMPDTNTPQAQYVEEKMIHYLVKKYKGHLEIIN